LFSIERFLIVFYPFNSINNKDNSQIRIKISFLVLAIVSIAFYSHLFVTSGLESDSNSKQCVTLEKWFDVEKRVLLIDYLLTLVFPLFIIATMNIFISSRLIQLSRNMRRSHQRSSIVSLRISESATARSPSILIGRRANLLRLISNGKKKSSRDISAIVNLPQPQKERRFKKYIKSTRMLFIISITYLILNTPIAICKIRYSLQSFNSLFSAENSLVSIAVKNVSNSSSIESNYLEEIFERFSCYIYYMNFTLNFVFYLLSFKDS
jgi:hypothetical protein